MARIAAIGRFAALAAMAASASLPLQAQQTRYEPREVGAADYAKAERFMTYNTTPLVMHAAGRATWVSDQNGERFWYRTTTEKGSEAILVNAADGARSACDLPACRTPPAEGGRGGGAAQRVD